MTRSNSPQESTQRNLLECAIVAFKEKNWSNYRTSSQVGRKTVGRRLGVKTVLNKTAVGLGILFLEMSFVGGGKPSIALFRDCMRLIKHVAGTTSPKAISLRQIVAQQFRANKHVSDPALLHSLKSSAERGLSNYLIFTNARTDPKVAAHAADVGQYQDDDNGNLIRVGDGMTPPPVIKKNANATAKSRGGGSQYPSTSSESTS